MKKNILSAILLVLLVCQAYPVTHTITNSGSAFSPANITISLGDTVVFSLGSIHNAVEVSQATYNSNGNVSNGGFSVPLGGDTVIFDSTGTFYYVCQPHASMGMKGIIQVGEITALNSIDENALKLKIFPNPASDRITISYSLKSTSRVTIELKNVTGATVAVLNNKTEPAGSYELNYSLRGYYSPGIYFVNFNLGNSQATKKLFIQ